MDPQPIGLEATLVPGSPANTFAVHFSNPSVRFGAQPQAHWKLMGAGSVVFETDRIVLRGRRPRPFWTGVDTEVPIPLANIMNVIRDGSVVQCHVLVSGRTQVLRLWSASEPAAEQLARKLPQERTAEFEERVAEQSSFNTALAALGTRARVTPALLLLNCVVFACTVYAGAGLFQVNAALLVHWGTNYGPRTLDGQWWRLFTAMFLHFGLLHLLLNMWALWGVGQLTEKLYGSIHFVLLYVFAGLTGSFASLYWHPNLNSAGASGAIFGVIGGLLAFMLNPATRIPPSVAALHLRGAAIFVIYNLFNGFTHAGVDNAAHIGGLLGGFGMGWVLARPVDIEARQESLPRVLIGSLLGTVVLLALAWPLLIHPNPTVAAERKFRQQFELYAEDEARALHLQHTLDELDASHKITDSEWARRLSTEVIPLWQAAEDRISATQLPADSRLAPLREAVIQFDIEKRFALDLFSDAARSGDPDKLAWAKEVSETNEENARKIQALIRQVYWK